MNSQNTKLFLIPLILLIFYRISLVLPSTYEAKWEISNLWSKNDQNIYTTTANSTEIVELCKKNPTGYLDFPVIMQGAQEVYLDEVKIGHLNSADFKHVELYYGSPTLKCEDIVMGTNLEWRAFSYASSFSHFNYLPRISKHFPIWKVFSESLNPLVVGGLLAFLFLVLFIFYGKNDEKKGLAPTLFFSILFLSIYFVCTTPAVFHLDIPMIYLHKYGDTSLWVGTLLFLIALSYEHLVGKSLIYLNFVIVSISLFLILTGKNGTEIQNGTNIPFFSVLPTFAYCTIRQGIATFKNFNRMKLYQFLSLFVYTFSTINDALVINGLISGVMLYSLGVFFGVCFFMLAINERILATYVERDHYRLELENSYQEKLKMIQDNAVAHTIANTVQMIAHDLKKPFAMVKLLVNQISSGNISPDLGKRLSEHIESTNLYVDGLLSDILIAGSQKTNRLEPVCLHSLASEIWKEINITDSINKHAFVLRIDHQGKLFVDSLKLRRLLSNLLNNALKAVNSTSETIWIHSSSTVQNGRDMAQIVVGNSNSYIPQKEQTKIFERFQGKDPQGSGLGLAICQEIVHAHGGTISCQSDPLKGTEFIFTLPVINSNI